MKMKDVIRLTGLTDRAVRLYIENGLIEPDISENYADDLSTEKLAQISCFSRCYFRWQTFSTN